MSEAFGVPVGLSDHTLGTAVPIAAVALGAVMIEKHLTLRRSDGGPDSGFSLEPDEFREMVADVRAAELAIGGVSYRPAESEAGTRSLRRSLFVVADVRRGEPFSHANVRSIRPGHGLHARYLPNVVGRVAAVDIDRGTPLTWDLIGRDD
jgi:N-acetylneuraminate synthase